MSILTTEANRPELEPKGRLSGKQALGLPARTHPPSFLDDPRIIQEKVKHLPML